MTMRIRLPAEKYTDPPARRAFFDRLEPRLMAIPGVEAAAVTTGVPPADERERLLEIDDPARAADARPVFVGTVTITPKFFDVVGLAMSRGRAFTDINGAPGACALLIANPFRARRPTIGGRSSACLLRSVTVRRKTRT